MARLGVNIDHVATLRQARGENYPSVERAAQVVLEQGVDQITVHLREDRRHIQDYDVLDVRKVCSRFGKLLNLEIGVGESVLDTAVAAHPDWVCLVPEKREERTTEGGLNLKNEAIFQQTKAFMKTLRSQIQGVKISLFVEADQTVLKKCKDLGAEAVEIHTGDFARDLLEGHSIDGHIERFKESQQLAGKLGIAHHAGHGLTQRSTAILVEQELFEEYNTGHWLISEAVFAGLGQVVRNMLDLVRK